MNRESFRRWPIVVSLLASIPTLAVAVPPEQRVVQPAAPNIAVAAATPAGAVPGDEYVPSAGYHRTVEMFRLRRQIGLPGMAFAPGVNLRLAGTRSVPVICVEFRNRQHDFEATEYQSMLFGPSGTLPDPIRPTFTQYYRDISNGQFIPTGQTLGWYTLPEDDTFYESGNNGLNERLAQLLRFAFENADDDIDFGQFDNDGPDGLPNSGDDDGVVDTIFIVHSETGGECGNNNLWSHSFRYSDFGANTGPFETDDDRLNDAGEPVLGTNSKIRIEDYTVQPGLSCDSTVSNKRIIPIGVFCHEYGHALGLPDLYDRTPADDRGPDSEGVGNYCLMAGGSYGANGSNAAMPVHMSAWCKALLGWATIENVGSNTSIDLEPVQARNLIYNVDVPGTDGKEYFLIEFRDSQWEDQFDERINWDQEFSPGGIAVWHVDESVGQSSANWPFSEHDEGQNDSPSLPDSAGNAFRAKHSLVSLIQRDGKLHLERKQNRFDAADLFINNIDFKDDPEFKAGSRSFKDGNPTGISVTQIDLATKTAIIKMDDFPPGFQPPARSPMPVAIAAAPPLSDVTSPTAMMPPSVQVYSRDITGRTSSEFPSAQQQTMSRLKTKAIQDPARKTFSRRELQELHSLETSQIKHQLAPQVAQQVLTQTAKERTRTVSKQENYSSKIDQAIANVLQLSEADQSRVRFDTAGQHVQRIADVELPVRGSTIKEDSVKRVQELLPLFANKSVQLDFESATKKDGEFHFAQVIDVEGKAIPLHCNGVTLYYVNDKFVGADSNLIDPEKIKVTGKQTELTNGQLAEMLATQLRVAPQRIAIQGQCIHMIQGDPENARIVSRVNVDVGENRAPLEVLVDGETSQLIEVE
ncbi:Immune inhibitor A precursor [Rubripirellula lacrimiformis]|uniref:Immune inhibitor A n=1 Tax=Rubripirellula lacrimiformis TaxID=1930273 RepID=A0A517N5K1_9BACT|nr:M6 family metalloprotease domain-containing protein [Rubripirellula lacrimiformis]QDT02391.1 Immune inhibitor A precursor [Rubripirellula lacrimiformis]